MNRMKFPADATSFFAKIEGPYALYMHQTVQYSIFWLPCFFRSQESFRTPNLPKHQHQGHHEGSDVRLGNHDKRKQSTQQHQIQHNRPTPRVQPISHPPGPGPGSSRQHRQHTNKPPRPLLKIPEPVSHTWSWVKFHPTLVKIHTTSHECMGALFLRKLIFF